MIIEQNGSTITKENFLNNLRNNTSVLHTQLEQLPVSLKLTSEHLRIEDYIRYLQLMQPVIEYTERVIFPQLNAVIDDIEERYKHQFIQNDLQFLNASSNASQFSFDIAEPGTATAIGMMYVIEGSTLGGRVILKNVHSVLGLTEEKGASYFSGYGSKTGIMWKHFIDMLVSFQIKNNQEEKIISGANAAFKGIFNFMK